MLSVVSDYKSLEVYGRFGTNTMAKAKAKSKVKAKTKAKTKAKVKRTRKVSRLKRLKKWTVSEISKLREEYPVTETTKLAKKLGRTLEAVRFKAKKHGLTKTVVYMESLYAKARKAVSRKKISKKRR